LGKSRRTRVRLGLCHSSSLGASESSVEAQPTMRSLSILSASFNSLPSSSSSSTSSTSSPSPSRLVATTLDPATDTTYAITQRSPAQPEGDYDFEVYRLSSSSSSSSPVRFPSLLTLIHRAHPSLHSPPFSPPSPPPLLPPHRPFLTFPPTTRKNPSSSPSTTNRKTMPLRLCWRMERWSKCS
jgi:hypothetical protein